ncbi:ACP S-malonyltransferase [Candidatus Omnitrophota bacterium]
MKKTVFLFPGQGSQEVGMARDLFSDDPRFAELVKHASQITGEDLTHVCLKGPEKKMINPRFLQPLIVAVSLGYLRHITEKNIKADFVIGHSLGEITALAAAGVVDNNQAIAIAAKRGELMNQAAALCNGGMMAVLSLPLEKIQESIHALKLNDKIFIANINAADQTVVSGDQSSFDHFKAQIVRAGGRCKKLSVAGPWHSPYLKQAGEKFSTWVEATDFNTAHTPIILNVSGEPHTDPSVIKQAIIASLTQPVQFRQCMDYCKFQQIDSFLEIGPGRVLAGLTRANGFLNEVNVYTVNSLPGVDRVASG